MTTRAMQEASLLIVTVLAAGSQHGYGIITEVREISGGRVRLRAGTLYAALDRLRADELIGVDREEIVDSRLRRYYRLTLAGARRPPAVAADETGRMTTRPDLRVGDADREAAAAALREHFAHGRLTFEELNAQLDAAFAAVTQGEMSRTTRDLPPVTMPSARAQPA